MFIKYFIIALVFLSSGYYLGQKNNVVKKEIHYQDKIVYVDKPYIEIQKEKCISQAPEVLKTREIASVNEVDNKNMSTNQSTSKRKNIRARLLFGHGYDGTNVVISSQSNVNVQPKKDFLIGVGFDYIIYKDISVGAQYLSNETAIGSIGLDF